MAKKTFLFSPRLGASAVKLFFFFLFLGGIFCHAAEVMPPKPARYFNDYANKVSAATAERLNKTLEDFEKETSSQIVVAIFPKMQSDSSIEDYA
ncbi:MAG: TPM domain-containing protein, partial [Limisphaerales bacterium]